MRSIVASPLNILLVAAPIAWVIHALTPASPWVFVTAATSLIPLAGLIGLGTEQLARRSGPGLGGFLNATFGNAAELIIAVVALRNGHVDLVKASITGSIIGNLLLVLGLSFFVGGLGRRSRNSIGRRPPTRRRCCFSRSSRWYPGGSTSLYGNLTAPAGVDRPVLERADPHRRLLRQPDLRLHFTAGFVPDDSSGR
jgi:hypothetical protein